MSSWAFIVLNWNGGEDTLRCLRSLSALPGDPLLVVADNGSTDGSLDAVRRDFPDAVVVENGRNLGYSGGNNAGIRAALERGAGWVVLVNNDARVAPETLDALRTAAERWPAAGVLAGKLYDDDADAHVQWAGQRVGLLTGYSGRPRGHGRPDAPELQREEPVDRAVGALMAVSRPAIEAAGLLDEDLFAYVEDVDWSLRIRAAGFACVFVPAARAWHALSASTGGEAISTAPLYYGTRNTIVVCERHRPLGRAGTLLRRLSIAATFALRAGVVLRSADGLRAVAQGYRDGVRRRLGPRPAAASAAS